MPSLVKIRSELFPKLYEAFLHDDDPLSDEQDWRHVFDYGWEKDEDYSGYALLDDDKVIGMMSMAFSKRLISGEPHKFCNLHTWWVHEAHRGRSTTMLRPLLQLDDYTVTHFTPCDRIRALTKRLGFVELNTQTKLLFPLRWSNRSGSSAASLVFDEEEILADLVGEERKIFLDHRPYRVGNLLIREGTKSCYILFTHVVRYRINYCHIHFVGNKEMFAEHEMAIRNALMRRHRVRCVVVDCRLVEKIKFPRSLNFWAPAHAVYKPSGDVKPCQVDNLYSDVVMLRLSVLPHISYELKTRLRRWFPKGRAR